MMDQRTLSNAELQRQEGWRADEISVLVKHAGLPRPVKRDPAIMQSRARHNPAKIARWKAGIAALIEQLANEED